MIVYVKSVQLTFVGEYAKAEGNLSISWCDLVPPTANPYGFCKLNQTIKLVTYYIQLHIWTGHYIKQEILHRKGN